MRDVASDRYLKVTTDLMELLITKDQTIYTLESTNLQACACKQQ